MNTVLDEVNDFLKYLQMHLFAFIQVFIYNFFSSRYVLVNVVNYILFNLIRTLEVHFFFQLCYHIFKEAECANTRQTKGLDGLIPSKLKGNRPHLGVQPLGGVLLFLEVIRDVCQ
ncbi:hypothetical protein [Paenibacillus sp. HB172176]|uniref:hypothetical protein n=1 Tax=Paenibacillus sp. HB172176 TaxID=2493690 RepID=UPI0014388095|nr:hypothetical protein [Paenibacillus sp. HB172176]